MSKFFWARIFDICPTFLCHVTLNLEGSAPSQFPADVCCGQVTGWLNMALGMEVGLRPGHIVLDSEPAPLPKKGADAPQFLADYYCGQTAVYIRMPLGTHR